MKALSGLELEMSFSSLLSTGKMNSLLVGAHESNDLSVLYFGRAKKKQH